MCPITHCDGCNLVRAVWYRVSRRGEIGYQGGPNFESCGTTADNRSLAIHADRVNYWGELIEMKLNLQIYKFIYLFDHTIEKIVFQINPVS